MNLTFQKALRNLAFIGVLFLSAGQLRAQLSGTKTIPTDYPDIASFITDLNAVGVGAGGVVFIVPAGHTETAPAGGFQITATGTSANPIAIAGGGMPKPIITANGALTAGALNDGIFVLVGSDYVTIDGLELQENAANNITAAGTNNMTEWGVALLYASVTDGSNNCTISNNTITLNKTYQNTFGIYANATHTLGAVTSSATATSPAGGNSGLKVYGNAISNINLGIVVVGPTAAANQNDGIDIGGTSALTGNTISNFATTSAFSSYANVSGTIYGVLVRNSKNINVSHNTITSSFGGNTTGALRGIYVPSFSNTPTGTFTNTFNSNTISLTSGNITGAVDAISIEGTSASATSSHSVSNNNFTALGFSAAGSGTLRFIATVSPALTVTVSGNTFTNVVSNTSGSVTFLAAGYSMPAGGTQTLNNNQVVGTFNKTGAGGSLIIFTSNSSSPAGSSHTATGNNFSNITVTGATTISGWSNTDGGQPTKTITGNTFTNWTGGTSGVTVINQNFGGNGSSVSNNTITNITAQSALTGIIIGGNNQGAAQQVNNNTINGLSTNGPGGLVTGITCAASSITTLTISGNTITNLSAPATLGNCSAIDVAATNTVNVSQNIITAVSVAAPTAVASGIVTTGTGGTINIFQNKIYDISNSGAATATVVNGILLQGGLTVNTHNNVIGGLTAPAASAANAINGISVTSAVTGSTYRTYYNSIYLNATSSGTNFGTSGIFHTVSGTATVASLDLRNNIIINESVAAGTGLTVAYRRSGTALNNYAAASNRNLFYAGTPSATNLIYTDGTTPQQTFAGYQGVVAARDANSFTGEAFTYATPGSFFVSLTPASVDFLRPVAGITSQAESGAIQITTPAITLDFGGVVRAGNIGYAGTGSNPDLGAFEFEGVSPAPVITINTVTPPVSAQCLTTARLVSVNVTTLSGTIATATINYAFDGVAQAPVSMTNISGTTWEGTIPTASPVNASVTWSVTAVSSVPLTTIIQGTTYQDEPAFGYTGVAAALSTTLCAGTPTDLTAKAEKSGTIKVGNGTSLTGATEELTAFGNRRITYHLQQTYSVAELTALGLSAGPITSIGFEITTLGDAANNTNFIVKMGSIGATTLTGFEPVGSMTTVFPSATYVHAVGVNTINFVTPYVWDGTSNIIVDFTYSGINSINNAQTYYTTTAANQTAFAYNGGAAALGTKRLNLYITGKVAASLSSLSWSDGVSTVGTTSPLTVNPTTTTTYTASISVAGCALTPSPAVMVTVNPLPTAPTATNSVQCGTQIPTASVTSTTVAVTPTFKWYDAPTAGTVLQSSTSTTFTTNISATTTFYVAEVDGVTGCESTRTPVTVTVSAADGVAAVADFGTICIGSSVELTGSNTNPTPNQTYTYTWTGVAGSGALVPVVGTVVTITPTAPGTYTYNLSGVDGSCNAVASVNVTVDPFVATLTPIAATCNGLANGSFSLNTSACGTMPYNYSVDGSAFGAIPTNLAAGPHNVVVEDDNGFQTSTIVVTVTQPAETISVPASSNIEICQDDASGEVTATSVFSTVTLVIPFNLSAQPTETQTAPGITISSATVPALPAGSVITGLTLASNGLVPHGGEYQSDVRLGLSGIFTNTAVAGTGTIGSGTPAETPYNYTRAIPVGGFPITGGTLNVVYWNNFNDVTSGDDCTFPTGPNAITLTITYSTPANITWWDAPTGGSQIGTGVPFETVGTSVLPNTSTAGTYTLYAGGEFGGCASPSRTPVNVTINEPTSSMIVAADCDAYTLNGTTYTSTGIYTQTVANVAGCDSTITLDLTIYGPTTSTTTAASCGSFMWTDGNTYTTSGMYTQTLTNITGCDSIATLDLTINNNASTTTINNCGSYTWTDGNTYGSTGTYQQTLTNVAGCDSIATLNLTVALPSSATMTDAACESYTLNGQTYTSTGMYIQNLTNVAGCDSTLTLDLTITFNSASNTPVTACDAYVWTDGNTYTTGGVYTQNLTNVAGCDSIATLTLTINATPVAAASDNGNATITASAGANYQWIDCATNAAITGETSQTLNVTVNGSYAVVVSNGSCSDTSNCVTINYIGMEENDAANRVSIYPNPTRGNVTITFNTATAIVEVYDAQGKLLTTTLIDNGSEISLSDYDRGVYYLKVKSEKETSTHRIVKN